MHFAVSRQLDSGWPFSKSKKEMPSTHRPFSRISGDEDAESQESLLDHHIELKTRSSPKSRIWRVCTVISMTIFVTAFIVLAVYSWNLRRSICVLGNERIFDDVPIKYQYQRFRRAGFHDTNHEDLTVYEGKPTRQNNAAWEHLIEAGVVAISREESDRLVNGTATTPANPDEYMVELEVFHQLHCLKWLRDQLWELEEVVAGTKSLEQIAQRMDHNDHCIDYLRQSIMCHGDVTPVTFEWNAEINNYLAHHSTEHQCRDFDAIFNWAQGRARTGLVADGAHQNVELNEPEMFD